MGTLQQWWGHCVISMIIIFINDQILNKHKECEQVVFIKGWSDNVMFIEMAGGEFCGNAIRSVMCYLNLTQGKTRAQIKYINYPLVVDCECSGSNCSFTANVNELVKRVVKIGNGFNKVEMEGITHYVIQPDSQYFQNRHSANKTKKLINMLIGNAPSVGIMYLENFKLIAYVYVKGVNTLYRETACGSGTIACSILFKDMKKINIDQPSGQSLNVRFNQEKLTLSGNCEMLLKDFLIMEE